MMKDLAPLWAKNSFPSRNSFDLILAITLKPHGVKEFYTRKTRDFESLGFFDVSNPL